MDILSQFNFLIIYKLNIINCVDALIKLEWDLNN